MHQIESPLVTVIKLISAESLADFDEAKKFIDLEKVYSNHPDTLSAEQAWKNQVLFFYNISKDKKFTNNFKYYDYNIKETKDGDRAKVIFESILPEKVINRIVYDLNLYNKSWVITAIEYQQK